MSDEYQLPPEPKIYPHDWETLRQECNNLSKEERETALEAAKKYIFIECPKCAKVRETVEKIKAMNKACEPRDYYIELLEEALK